MPSKRVRCIDLSRRFAGPASRETTQTGIHGARAEDEVRNAASAPGVTIVTDIDRKPFEEAIRLSRLFVQLVRGLIRTKPMTDLGADGAPQI